MGKEANDVAVIYARFSSDRQREESIEGQLRECHEYAKKQGIRIVGEYIDRALSASKDTEKRLDFLRMIEDSAKGTFNTVLVWKLDRFARDRYDSAHYKHLLKKNGVRVISATEPIGEGPEGIILEAMLEGMAEYYSAELSVKIKRGLKENALKGINNGGRTAFGYQLVGEKDGPKHYEPDPVTAPYVREIFARYADGDDTKLIADDLNKRGITTNYGGKFHYSTIATILANRTYLGEYRYADVVNENAFPSLVDKATFDRAQERLERNKHTPAAGKADEKYLLTTKLFCGDCGAPMAGESGKGRNGNIHRYYKCMNAKRKRGCHLKAVKKDLIEDLVVRHTMELVFDDEVIDRLTDRLVELQGEEPYDIKLLDRELSETNKSISNMLSAIEQGIVTKATKQRLEALEARQEELEVALAQAKLESSVLSKEEIHFFLTRFRDTDITNEKERQRLIDSFVNAVFVYTDKIVLTFNFRDGTKTVSLNDVDGSDLEGPTPPEEQNPNIVQIRAVFGFAVYPEQKIKARYPRDHGYRAFALAINGYRRLPGWKTLLHASSIAFLRDKTLSKRRGFYKKRTDRYCVDRHRLMRRPDSRRCVHRRRF